MAQPLLAQSRATLPGTLVQDSFVDQAEKAYEQFLQSNHALSASELLRPLQNFLEKWPSHLGAMLDLALLHCELGDWRAMDEQFQSMERRVRLPVGIAELIHLQRHKGCTRRNKDLPDNPPSKWIWDTSVGFSSNANLATDVRRVVFASDAPIASLDLTETNRRKADSFVSFGLSGQRAFADASQWRLDITQKQYVRSQWLNHWGLQLGFWKPYDHLTSESSAIASASPSPSGVHFGLSQWWVDNHHQESSVQVRLEHWYDLLPERLGHIGLVSLIQYQVYTRDHLFDARTVEVGGRWSRKWLFGGWSHFGIDFFNDTPTNARPGGSRRGWLGHASLIFSGRLGSFSVSGLVRDTTESEPYNYAFFGELRRRQLRQQLIATYTPNQSWLTQLSLNGQRVRLFAQTVLDQADDELRFFSFRSATLRLGLRTDL